jgi:hypothetical protein
MRISLSLVKYTDHVGARHRCAISHGLVWTPVLSGLTYLNWWVVLWILNSGEKKEFKVHERLCWPKEA